MSTTSEQNAENAFFSPKVVGGIPWALFSRFVLFFVYLAIPILIVRSLGAERYGLFSLCKFVAECCIVACGLGLNTALIRFIPELCVAKNRAGLVRILTRVAGLQTAAVAIAVLVLYLAKPWLDARFHVDFQYFLFSAALLAAARLLKNLVDDSYTAFFKIRVVSILSISQALLTFGLVAAILPRLPGVHMALLAQSLPILATSAAGFFLLVKYIGQLNWKSPPYGIGKRRVIGISGPSILNSFASMVLSRYSELFFLGIFYTPAIVGLYEVGCGFPFMIITFLPMALQSLLTSGLSEAYSRDPGCLPSLVSAIYKILIVTILPMAAFGVFFAAQSIEVLYGVEMKDAGPIAAWFFIVHTLGLVSTPLAMAIVAKEKLLHMQPLMVLQIAVNLVLDYVLVKRFGMYGGVAAIVGTFVLTIPIRLYVVARVVGGIYFPGRFFLKFVVTLFVWAALLSPLAPYVNLAGLVGLGVAYILGYLLMIRVFHLVRNTDVESLRSLGFGKLNRVLDLLIAEHCHV